MITSNFSKIYQPSLQDNKIIIPITFKGLTAKEDTFNKSLSTVTFGAKKQSNESKNIFDLTENGYDEVITKYLLSMGVDANNGKIAQFKDFMAALPKRMVKSSTKAMQKWIELLEKPDKAGTGGTINTVTYDGTRIPNVGTMISLVQAGGDKIRKQIVVFPGLALDSSNHNRDTQTKLMKEIGNVAFEDIKAVNQKKGTITKANEYINVEEIPYYYSFPQAVGPGLVLTHGTDTLDENSSLSAYMLSPKPLVWTGSWAGPEEPGSDAINNIEKSEALAGNSLTPIGSYVVIGNEIHLATRLKKINTHPWNPEKDLGYSVPFNTPKPWRPEGQDASYFASVDDNPVGYFDENGEILFSKTFLDEWEKILAQRFKYNNLLTPARNLEPAYVEHVIINKDTPREVFDDLIKRLEKGGKAKRGAIVEGDFYQHPDFKEFEKKINRLAEKGRFIIQTSSCEKTTDPGKCCNTIMPTQLRTKLAALLGRDSQNNLFAPRDLWMDYAGEVINKDIVKKFEFNVPKSFYNNGEFVVAFPGMQSQIIDDAVKRLISKNVPNPVLLINGFGDGHVPIGPMSMEQRLNMGLDKLAENGLCEKDLGEKLNKSIQSENPSVYSVPNIEKHLTNLLNGDKDKATKLLKGAFLESDDILKSLGDALANGITVLIGTKAEYAVPNLKAYEIGTVLDYIGVKGLTKPTREYLKDFKD